MKQVGPTFSSLMSDEKEGMPIYGPMLEVGVYDPVDAPEAVQWAAGCEESAELVVALEGCKQVIELAHLVVPDKPNGRACTLLATPVYSLAQHTLKLHRLLGRCDRSQWPESDKQAFVVSSRQLKKMVNGPLKRHRDKRSAHLDPAGLNPNAGLPPMAPQVVLEPLGLSVVLLMLSLNHESVFQFIRVPDPERPNEFQVTLTYPIATVIELLPEGRASITGFQLTSDLRHECSSIIKRATDAYNVMVRASGVDLPPIEYTKQGRRGDTYRKFDVPILHADRRS